MKLGIILVSSASFIKCLGKTNVLLNFHIEAFSVVVISAKESFLLQEHSFPLVFFMFPPQ